MKNHKFKRIETCGERSRTIGEIPKGWEERKLGALGEIVTGKTPSTLNKDNFGVEYPFITPRDMKGQKYIEDTERYLSEQGKNEVHNCILPGSTICVSCIGSDMGKVVMTTQSSVTNQQLNSIIPRDIDPDFVYYAVKNISGDLRNMAFHSTAVPILNKSSFARFQILIPKNRNEAKRIAKILSDLDDKIELNHQMNKTLESIAQAIFKRWFVDFEFSNDKGKPYKSSGGEMVDSELGKIPKEWGVKKLGDFVNVIKGVSYRSDELKESDKALVTLKSIDRGGGLNKNGFKEYIGGYKKEQEIIDGDIVVAHTDITQKAEVLGKPAIVRTIQKYKTIVASLDLSIVRPRDNTTNKTYLYYLLKSENFQNHAFGYANGTTVLHLSNKALPEYLFILPGKELVSKFEDSIGQLLNKKKENEAEIENLLLLRDSLLPKLMSGRIGVAQ